MKFNQRERVHNKLTPDTRSSLSLNDRCRGCRLRACKSRRKGRRRSGQDITLLTVVTSLEILPPPASLRLSADRTALFTRHFCIGPDRLYIARLLFCSPLFKHNYSSVLSALCSCLLCDTRGITNSIHHYFFFFFEWENWTLSILFPPFLIIQIMKKSSSAPFLLFLTMLVCYLFICNFYLIEHFFHQYLHSLLCLVWFFNAGFLI